MILLNFFAAFILAFIIAIISSKLKFLTLEGILAQFVLAVLIFGFGGLKWAVPIIVFFFLSSILSTIRGKKNKNVELYFEKPNQRDQYQVFANGGISGLLVILSQFIKPELLYYIYVSSIAAVCADTWATEIGTMWKTRTINILSFKEEEQGTSGAISLNGMLGSLLGAVMISLSSLYWIRPDKLYYLYFTAAAGLFGSIVDSIIGASVQAQYYCEVCGKITEKKFHCFRNANKIKGISWLNNDVVNFITSLSGGFFFILFRIFLKV